MSALSPGCLKKVVEQAKWEGVRFRQTYVQSLPKLLRKIRGYGHARQYRRMRGELKTLCNYLGRVLRDLERQLPYEEQSTALQQLYRQSLQVLIQSTDRKSKNKLYSLHEPEIVCIAKGKVRTPYEFGHKVSVVSTAKEQLVVDSQALRGNPYDGHTLDYALLRAWSHTEVLPSHALVDRGYRGSQDSLYAEVHISGKRQGSGKAHQQQHRRNAIEPIIGHMKVDGLLSRCHLKGFAGSAIHAVLCGVGQNLRKILRHLRRIFWPWFLSGFWAGIWRDLLRIIRQNPSPAFAI